MAYKNKTYICFDGDSDIHYFYLMNAWKHNNQPWFREFNFHDAHEINYARDSSQEESIKSQLRVRLSNSKLFVVLIGEQTQFLYKFVKWEIEQALRLELPIICVNLNGRRQFDDQRCPPIIKKELAVHVSFNQKIIELAINEWGNSDSMYRVHGKSGPYHYGEEVYRRLGIQ